MLHLKIPWYVLFCFNHGLIEICQLIFTAVQKSKNNLISCQTLKIQILKSMYRSIIFRKYCFNKEFERKIYHTVLLCRIICLTVFNSLHTYTTNYKIWIRVRIRIQNGFDFIWFSCTCCFRQNWFLITSCHFNLTATKWRKLLLVGFWEHIVDNNVS